VGHAGRLDEKRLRQGRARGCGTPAGHHAARAGRAGRTDLGPSDRARADALTGIAALSNIAAAAGADEVVLAWETQEVATACELPVSGPSPCLNMVRATPDGHVLHQFPYTEESLSAGSGNADEAATALGWDQAPEPRPDGELPPPVEAAVAYAFTPMELDHPNPFGVTVVLMEEDGYTVRLSDDFDH
jgi:hypothetical protein